MRIQTIKKDPDNRGLSELLERIRSIWLPLMDELRTYDKEFMAELVERD